MKPNLVVQDNNYSCMYRLQWKDGVLSEDMYNLTRANDILRNYSEYRYNMKKSGELKKNNHLVNAKKAQDASL